MTPTRGRRAHCLAEPLPRAVPGAVVPGGVTSLAGLRWPDVERLAAETVLVVPLGATEQHGPHLPLSTDTDIAQALVAGLVERHSHVVAAPAIGYGASGEHGAFAGTLSIGQSAAELLLLELCRSASQTFRRILLVSTHGGNAEPVRRAVRRLRDEGRDVRAWGPRWNGDAHAGRTETSLMLAITPERVRMAAAAAGATAAIADLLPRLRAEGVRAVSANGVLGDPTGASAEEGFRLLEAAGQDVDMMVAAWDG